MPRLPYGFVRFHKKMEEESNCIALPLPSQQTSPKKSEKLGIRREYYQTESEVLLNVLVKNTKSKNLKVVFEPERIQIDTKLSDGTDYNLNLRLFRPIDTSACSFKVLDTEIEIKMRKLDSFVWTTFEATEKQTRG